MGKIEETAATRARSSAATRRDPTKEFLRRSKLIFLLIDFNSSIANILNILEEKPVKISRHLQEIEIVMGLDSLTATCTVCMHAVPDCLVVGVLGLVDMYLCSTTYFS